MDEQRITVTRGKIAYFPAVPSAGRKGVILSGATGSGKSTFGLLKLLCSVANSKLRFLMIQPTKANAGNVFADFQDTMPPIVASQYPQYAGYPRPKEWRGEEPAPGKFYVAPAELVFDRFIKNRVMCNFDVVMLDEYHLVSEVVVALKWWLRYTELLPSLYILSSATPEGKAIEAPIPERLTLQTDEFPLASALASINTYQGSWYNPRNYSGWGNEKVVVFVPTTSMLSRLVEHSTSMGIKFAVIDASTEIQRYRDIRRSTYTAGPLAIYLTPDVEAGITLDASVFVDCGTSRGVRYENSVLYATDFFNSGAAATQRRGRAARNMRATFIQNVKDVGKDTGASAGIYYDALAMIYLTALGKDMSRVDNEAYDAYRGLSMLTRDSALKALSEIGVSPLLALTRYNSRGEKYKECGGDASEFFETWWPSLKIFRWKSDYVVAPFFSLVDNRFDPTELIEPRYIPSLLRKLVGEYGIRESDYDLTNLIVKNKELFAASITRVLKVVCKQDGKTTWTDGSGGPSTLDAVLAGTTIDLATVLRSLDSLPGYELETIYSGAPPNSAQFKLVTPSGVVWVDPKPEYIKSGTLDGDKFGEALTKLLQDKIDVALLSTRTGVVVDLRDYKEVADPYHVFYRKYVKENNALEVLYEEDFERERINGVTAIYNENLANVQAVVSESQLADIDLIDKPVVVQLPRSSRVYRQYTALGQVYNNDQYSYTGRGYTREDIGKYLGWLYKSAQGSKHRRHDTHSDVVAYSLAAKDFEANHPERVGLLKAVERKADVVILLNRAVCRFKYALGELQNLPDQSDDSLKAWLRKDGCFPSYNDLPSWTPTGAPYTSKNLDALLADYKGYYGTDTSNSHLYTDAELVTV